MGLGYDLLYCTHDVNNVAAASVVAHPACTGYDEVFTMGPEQFAAPNDATIAELEFSQMRREDTAPSV